MKIKKVNEIRDIQKMNTINDGNRTLFESIISQEIVLALEDWIKQEKNNYVLIGGLALSYYVRPRYTTDVDILFLSENNIPNKVVNFKKHRKLAFQHNQTHVEIETITPESINVPIDIVKKVFETSIIKDDIKIASSSGLVSLKMFRFDLQDKADIVNLIKNTNVDLTPFNLPDILINKYNKLKRKNEN